MFYTSSYTNFTIQTVFTLLSKEIFTKRHFFLFGCTKFKKKNVDNKLNVTKTDDSCSFIEGTIRCRQNKEMLVTIFSTFSTMFSKGKFLRVGIVWQRVRGTEDTS